jgi:hypothetical protein
MLRTSGEAIASGSTQGVAVAAVACVHEGLVKMLKVGVILLFAVYTLFFICIQCEIPTYWMLVQALCYKLEGRWFESR